jgi:hypothetical protein
MLIHRQNSHAPRGRQRTGRRKAQSRGPGLHSKNIPCGKLLLICQLIRMQLRILLLKEIGI